MKNILKNIKSIINKTINKLVNILLVFASLTILGAVIGGCISRSAKELDAQETIREIEVLKLDEKLYDNSNKVARLEALLEKNHRDYIEGYTPNLIK